MVERDASKKQLACSYMLIEDIIKLQYTSPFGIRAAVQARGTFNTGLQPPYLQQTTDLPFPLCPHQ
jgi:hypothetical protein